MNAGSMHMHSFAADFSRAQTVFLFSLLIVTLQFVAISVAIFYMQRRYRGLESQRKKYSFSNRLFIRLEASLSQLQVLEKIHLVNVQQKLAYEVEEQLNALWMGIEKALSQFAAVELAGKANFSVLSVRAGFDLYRQMQQDFIGHSKLGEKAFAQHLLNSKGKDLRTSLESVLKSGRDTSFKYLFAGYQANRAMDFVWMAYPLILIFLSFAVFVGMYAFP